MIQAVSNMFRRMPLRVNVPLALVLLISGTAGNLSLPSLISTDARNESDEFVSLALTSRDLYGGSPSTWRHAEIGSDLIDGETLWLARCIYSETKDPGEMELVAWVVRNRVETGYRGKWTYEEVVLDPFQFSAFNRSSTKRYYYGNLRPESQAAGWQRALRIAYMVRTDPGIGRPFSRTTRHFFSERSMTGRRHPSWAHGSTPVGVNDVYDVPAERFRFYEGIL
jgi:hypothetical protein